MPIFTVGHSTRSTDALIALLEAAGVDLLVDVRSMPHSRANPQFNLEVLPKTLSAAGIGYHHLPALGGRRGPPEQQGPSPNTYWRIGGFRNYADHALTAAFRAGLEELLALSAGHTAAIMCAEAVWWRCHRRIIADYLIAAGIEVRHILAAGTIEPARMTPAAVRQADGSLIYSAAQGSLL